MASGSKGRKRERGGIFQLPSGALRVRVYAGIDPVTKRRHDLLKIIPAGPNAQAEAEATLRRFRAELDERRNPRTNATVNQLLDRYLDMHTGGASTVSGYHDYVDKHVRPFIGSVKVGALEPEVVDSLYAELRRCREHCSGRRHIQHRTKVQHQCDERCRAHQCMPLANATIRKIHFILSGAYKRAVRWKWVTTSPITQAEPPSAPPPDPQPPTAEEAALLLNEAWRDPDWGTLVWLTMTTGIRRGELCALRWKHVNLDNGVITVRRAIAQNGTHTEEKDTKTHQRRHVTLDPETIDVLSEHLARCENRAQALGAALTPESFIFSTAPGSNTHLVPSAVTHRYSRTATRVGVDTHLHNLRHYSATELIAAGVDVRTVAGRLGHGSGGVTTLRVYAAWVAEADQRAAAGLTTRLPSRPTSEPDGIQRVLTAPRAPYERIAVQLRAAILDGTYPPGVPMPTGKQLAAAHGVATGTAQRAVALLRTWGLIDVSRGQRATVVQQPPTEAESDEQPTSTVVTPAPDDPGTTTGSGKSQVEKQLLQVEIRRLGQVVKTLSVEADPADAGELRQVLVDAIKREGQDESQIAWYEMDIRHIGDPAVMFTFAATK